MSGFTEIIWFLIFLRRIPHIIIFGLRPAASRRLRRKATSRRPLRLSLLKFGPFLFEQWTACQILLPVKEDLTIYECGIHTRVNTQRMVIPDCQVSVLANFDRTHPILNAELNCGIDRNQLERFFFTQ